MSFKAIDPETNKIVLASEGVFQKDYKCCNPSCSAILRLWRSSPPHFSAIKKHPHIHDCDYSNNHASENYHLPKNFLIEDFIESLEDVMCDIHIKTRTTAILKSPAQLYIYLP